MPEPFGKTDEPIRLFRPADTAALLPDALARRVATLAAGCIGLIASGAVAAAMVTHGGALLSALMSRATLPPPAIAAAAPVQELAGPAVKPFLLPHVDYRQTFTGLYTEPARLCRALLDAGFDVSPWAPSPAGRGLWECGTPDAAETYSHGVPSSSLYIMVRGSEHGPVDTLRLKLNLLDEDQNGRIVSEARRLIDVAGSFTDLALPTAAVKDVAALREVRAADYAVRVRFGPERSDPRRYNLVATYQPELALWEK